MTHTPHTAPQGAAPVELTARERTARALSLSHATGRTGADLLAYGTRSIRNAGRVHAGTVFALFIDGKRAPFGCAWIVANLGDADRVAEAVNASLVA